MKKIRFFLTALLTIGAVSIGVFMYQVEAQRSACLPGKVGLSDDAPPRLVAAFDYDCATFFPETQRQDRIGFALTFGYPSLLFDLMPEEEALDVVAMAAQVGESRFFTSDPRILDELDALASKYDIEFELGFIRALKRPEAGFAEASVSHPFLMALPLWGHPENMARLSEWCSAYACNKTTSVCDKKVGFADKLSIARNEKSFEEVYTLCPLTYDWLIALRRAGLVDTFCGSIFQINTVKDVPETLGKACFPSDFSFTTVSTDRDAAEFLRQQFVKGELFNINPANLKVIRNYFPEIAEYISRNLHRGG